MESAEKEPEVFATFEGKLLAKGTLKKGSYYDPEARKFITFQGNIIGFIFRKKVLITMILSSGQAVPLSERNKVMFENI